MCIIKSDYRDSPFSLNSYGFVIQCLFNLFGSSEFWLPGLSVDAEREKEKLIKYLKLCYED